MHCSFSSAPEPDTSDPNIRILQKPPSMTILPPLVGTHEAKSLNTHSQITEDAAHLFGVSPDPEQPILNQKEDIQATSSQNFVEQERDTPTTTTNELNAAFKENEQYLEPTDENKTDNHDSAFIEDDLRAESKDPPSENNTNGIDVETRDEVSNQNKQFESLEASEHELEGLNENIDAATGDGEQTADKVVVFDVEAQNNDQDVGGETLKEANISTEDETNMNDSSC